MTAIVGILNKHGVAVAADSALTVTSGNSRKIYNTSQKIFPLSDSSPVAIMAYDNALFMGVPWEVIVSLYRKEHGDKSFRTISDCCDDFLSFLRNSGYFAGKENQKWFFLRELRQVYGKLTGAAEARADEEIGQMADPTEEQKQAVVRKHLLDVLKELQKLCREEGKAEDLKGYSFRDFEKFTVDFWNEFRIIPDVSIDEDILDVWHKAMYEYITSEFFYKCSGLVFIGYGSGDLFPSYQSIYVSGIFDGKLRWCQDDSDQIQAEKETAMICPFAQDDVIMTMVNGIAPDLRAKIEEENREELAGYRDEVISRLREAGTSEDVIDSVSKIDNEGYGQTFEKHISSFMKDNYIDGTLDAVESFNVDDLADMAGSLISITNLQRHFSSSEESVGGPVDIAVITKADGFRWARRKEGLF